MYGLGFGFWVFRLKDWGLQALGLMMVIEAEFRLPDVGFRILRFSTSCFRRFFAGF